MNGYSYDMAAKEQLRPAQAQPGRQVTFVVKDVGDIFHHWQLFLLTTQANLRRFL